MTTYTENTTLLSTHRNSSHARSALNGAKPSSILTGLLNPLMHRAFLYKSALETHIKKTHSAKSEQRNEAKKDYKAQCDLCLKKYPFEPRNLIEGFAVRPY